MLRTLFLMAIFFWVGRLALRLVSKVSSATRRHQPHTPRNRRGGKSETDPLRDLTQQEISDADYEEIPPDEENRP